MAERLITPPSALAVSLDAARRVARVSGTSLDAELTDKIQGFTEDAEHATARAFVQQTWAVFLDAFPDAIKLPKSPLISVDHVKFYDADGVLQTLDPQDYLVDDKSEPGWVVPAPGLAWPATATRINAVEVQFVCGYGQSDQSVPASIKQYILGMLENEYYPNANAQFLGRLLDREKVYG
jgi:uncharacterized phiE125 gp8 family phage protein